MVVILGSTPIKDILGRVPMDLDLLGTIQSIKTWADKRNVDYTAQKHQKNKISLHFADGLIADCEVVTTDTTSYELYQLVLDDPSSGFDEVNNGITASPEVLYMLKMSHRFLKNNPHFKKTMDDIHKLRTVGLSIRDDHKEFYKRRVKETLHYSHPNLMQDKDSFFVKNEAFYVYDHDTIHEAVRLFDKPAYEYYKPDSSEVFTSKEMFYAIDEKYRLAGVYEEAAVLALERSQIPNNFEIDKHKSFLIALEKVCTSITSGWFREYAWENYSKVLDLYSKNDYLEDFHKNKHLLKEFVR